jgi:hypothetical protein
MHPQVQHKHTNSMPKTLTSADSDEIDALCTKSVTKWRIRRLMHHPSTRNATSHAKHYEFDAICNRRAKDAWRTNSTSVLVVYYQNITTMLGHQHIYSTTKHWPVQGSRLFGVHPLVVYTCFLCDTRRKKQRHVFGAPHRGASHPCACCLLCTVRGKVYAPRLG